MPLSSQVSHRDLEWDSACRGFEQFRRSGRGGGYPSLNVPNNTRQDDGEDIDMPETKTARKYEKARTTDKVWTGEERAARLATAEERKAASDRSPGDER